MALREIIILPDKQLRLVSKPIEKVTPEIRKLADDMFETMYDAPGIGLAAPQVGRIERLAVVDVDDNPLVIINPEVVHAEGKDKAEEGCLSIPDVYGDVERPERVRVRATNLEGQEFEVEADGLFARCLQHEIDHLHGKLFIDYLSVLKRRSAMAKWAKEKDKYPGFIRRLESDPARSHEHPDEEL